MDLLQTIINYYQGEARHGFWGAVIGGLLIIGGLILLRWASPLSLLKGMSVPMLLFGLLLGIGGGADSIYTNKTSPEKIAFYQNDANSFLKQEKVKVEKIHQGWRGIRIFWGILGLGGLILSFLIRKPFWLGAGIGTVALAIIISVFELYSMRFNERYYKAIQSASAQEPNTNAGKIDTVHKQPLVSHNTLAQPTANKPKQLKLKSAVLYDTMPTFDSRKISSGESEFVESDSIICKTTGDSIRAVALNETALIDDRNTNHNRFRYPKNHHCWLSKRHFKKGS